MLQGAENIDCFCDYTLTLSNMLCVERKKPIGVCLFFLFVKVCVYLQLCFCVYFLVFLMRVWLCVYLCTRVDQTVAGWRDGETDP